ncbi:MBL fold metallo-hydrolase [Streptomyces sp. UNOB3_S3]|uniref:MBL fold metallo-hydrolase n=1 Tax=Streptomyces sp. UNOB3_S3 TaxID=2871682 RepID=UPI001E5048C9|nr:MBL fold metallo-hydrolase [Streptomyces sp. UNOB3_S3]MCC3776187.1 MBL fold metallo-hydrolase [Streptomyces sp. UNOB3_S3]
MTTNSQHSQGDRLRRPSGIRSLQLGDIKLTYVPDGVVQLSGRGWLPTSTEAEWAAHSAYLDDSGYVVAGMGGLLVEHGDRALLIDAGFGPQSFPAGEDGPIGAVSGGTLLDSLAEIGRTPADIEAVAVTHLHIDHIGWLWQSAPDAERPPFAHAGYLVSEQEWTHRHLLEEHGITKEMTAILEPRIRTVADGEEIFPGVRVVLSQGHTAGHASYVISGGGRRVIAFGDAMHTPVQVSHPEWSAVVDHDAERSAAYRRRLVEELAEPNTIGFGIHFADVAFGRAHLDTAGGPAVWEPVDA